MAFRTAHGERRALVRRVGPHVHNATRPPVEIDLKRVASGIAEEAGRVPFIGRGVIQPCLGGLQDRRLPLTLLSWRGFARLQDEQPEEWICAHMHW